MRNFIVILTLICFATTTVPAVSWAEPPSTFTYDAVSPLDKGDRAPFQGILFSKDLAAKIEAERKTLITLKLAEAKTSAAVEIARSEMQLKLDVANGKYAALQEKHEKIVEINNEQIDFLRKNYRPTPWYEHPGFVVSMGLLAGIGLTIGAAHIVKTVK